MLLVWITGKSTEIQEQPLISGTGWGIVREGVITITNTRHAQRTWLLLQRISSLCFYPICGASWISGLLFRAERGKKERGERKERRKPAGNRGSWCTAGTPGHLPTWLLPLVTCLVVKWVVSAWIVLETPDRAVLRFSGNTENFFTSKGLRGTHLYFPLFTHFPLTTRSHFVSSSHLSLQTLLLARPPLLYKCVHGILFR